MAASAFTDVATTSWYSGSVEAAAAAGMVGRGSNLLPGSTTVGD